MDTKSKFITASIVISYLVLNIIYFQFDVPKLFYPNTSLIYFFIIAMIAWKFKEIKEEETIEKVELTLTETVPKQRLEKELEMAKRVQEGLLSVESPEISGVRIAKKCTPAKSVGGDFYTFVSKEFNSLAPKEKSMGIVEYFDRQDVYLGIAIGDVAGHGVSSALIMALSSGILGEIGKQHRSPAKTLEYTNANLIKYLQNSQISHITAFYGVLNTSSKKLQYAKGGHPPAIVIRKDNSITDLDSDGVFLGMFANETFEEKEIELHSGDRVFFYTDGITETKNPSGEFYGTDRFKAFLQDNNDKPIGSLINLVFDEIDRFSNHQLAKDDRSLVILEIE